MRVAVVSLFTPEHGDTPARARTHRTAAGLAARGHEVVWLCARWWGGSVQTFEQGGLTYRAVVSEPSPAAFAARLPAAFARVDADVVHAVCSPPAPAVVATVTDRLGGPPVVVDWWADHPADARSAYRLLASTARAVTTPSEVSATQVREHGATTDLIRVVPEQIDMTRIADTPVDDRFDVVYSRRLDRHAGVETVLLALAERRQADWRAAVIGDGPERDRFESLAAELRIDDRVAFLGDCSLSTRLSVFKGTHVFTQTATREPFATELLRALACGCVGLVEYQADASAHELVEGHERGRLVTSPASLADAMAAVDGLDRRAVDPAFAAYDADAVVERYLECYRSVFAV